MTKRKGKSKAATAPDKATVAAVKETLKKIAPPKKATAPKAKPAAPAPEAKAAKPDKTPAAPTIPDAVQASIKAARDKPMTAGDLSGPFKLTKVALDAKTPEALRLRAGSSRYGLMAFIFANAAKHPQGFTREVLVEKAGVGDQLGQALSGMVRYGFLA